MISPSQNIDWLTSDTYLVGYLLYISWWITSLHLQFVCVRRHIIYKEKELKSLAHTVCAVSSRVHWQSLATHICSAQANQNFHAILFKRFVRPWPSTGDARAENSMYGACAHSVPTLHNRYVEEERNLDGKNMKAHKYINVWPKGHKMDELPALPKKMMSWQAKCCNHWFTR